MILDSDDRPWGRWEVLLDEDYCKVKRIIVKPNKRLSYQKHYKREEVWTIVQGDALITLDGVVKEYKEGSVVQIPKEAAHRISNETDKTVIFIEVQMGSYFGEDDIVRLEDDYGRV
jgi:mannose-6-phosphate isomerase